MAKRLIFFVDAWDPAKIARRDKDAFVHNSFEIDREAIEKMPPVDALRWFMEHHNCAVADMLNLAPTHRYRATVCVSMTEDASDAEPITRTERTSPPGSAITEETLTLSPSARANLTV